MSTEPKIKAVAAVAYLATIVAANWLTAEYGLVPIGFGLAATDRHGSTWKRQPDDKLWWERTDAPRVMPEPQLIDRCGPLTEVEETNDAD